MTQPLFIDETRINTGPPHNGGGFFERLTFFTRMLPSFFILGAQKSGTTSLFYNLVQHPGIVRPKRKEVFYFDNDNRFSKGVNWYKSYFPVSLAHRGKITLDASTAYLDAPQCPERIKALLPDAKFIIILRNPVNRAFSHFNMSVRFGFEKTDFRNALLLEKQRIEAGRHLSHNFNYYQLGYASRGEYHRFIKHWYEHFPPERFLILDLHDWENHTAEVYVKVLDFLNLDRYMPASFEIKNEGEGQVNQDEWTLHFLKEHFIEHNAQLNSLLNRSFRW